jgi:rod shape-determining protein MreB
MSEMLGSLRSTLSPDLGLDLGTANTVVFERGGTILSEPSAVAVDSRDGRIVAVGSAAKAMDGRAPRHINVIRPLRRGTISDFRAAEALVQTVVDRALSTRARIAPRFVSCVPGCATDVECKAVEQAVRAAGASSATFVPQAVAAAIGAGLDISTNKPVMVVDIGGGTTEIAILALYGVVTLSSLTVGGDDFDAAIASRIGATRFHIGLPTAESLKIRLGYAGAAPGRASVRVGGLDLRDGAPRAREVDERLVGEAMRDGIDRIVRAVTAVLENAPPEICGDLIENGIMLTGGGALIEGLAAELGMRVNLPAAVAPEPLLCVARGAGEILGSPTLLERVRPHADRFTRWYQSLRIGMRESYSP